ncbi:MAG: iron-containing alcohol dehydrogenase [Spirochaetaceae bacterium]|nr:MAG: iron-containing alcohol dehydrogenase [Spirochaetaceae bacterium]
MGESRISTFEFATATTIRFGVGLSRSPDEYALFRGLRVFLLTGSDPSRYEATIQAVRETATVVTIEQTRGEPDTVEIMRLVTEARASDAQAVMSVGGGSVIDAGKVVAALLTNHGALFDYLEVIGSGQPIVHAPAPFAAVPTTAGTGSEVTRNAVIGSTEHGVKVSMRSKDMLPDLALVDPGLCLTLPERATLLSGLDAATQLIEAYTSRKANVMTDALCVEGLHHFSRGFESTVEHARSARGVTGATEDDIDARSRMCVASLFSGLALANAGLGAVHGFAGPIGGMTGAPHGALCAALLSEVSRMNIDHADQHTLQRYQRVAEIIFGEDTTYRDLPDLLYHRVQQHGVDRLSDLGLTPDRYAEAAEKAQRAGSMKGNPVIFSDEQLIDVLERSA